LTASAPDRPRTAPLRTDVDPQLSQIPSRVSIRHTTDAAHGVEVTHHGGTQFMASGMQTVVYPVKDLQSVNTTMNRVAYWVCTGLVVVFIGSGGLAYAMLL